MEVSDYYCPETTISKFGYGLGHGSRTITVKTIEAINPLKASAAVGVVWGGIAALCNARKYKQGRITKRDAMIDTVGESVGMGLAAGFGLLASNVERVSFVVASTSLIIPFAIGVIVTAGAKVIWNCNTKRYLKCDEYNVPQKLDKEIKCEIT